MIVIESITIDNIRALGHAHVAPLGVGGTTALNGVNGAGKSSVLTGLLWALFGVTPEGTPVGAMRRQGSEGQDCKVVVQFKHEDQTVIVERGLKGAKDSPYVTIHVDGFLHAFGKIRAANAWVVERLGLDAEGFLSAFVVRQKELDGLVKAKPAPRRALIERLAGIDRMSTAVKGARDEANETKRRLDLLPGTTETLRAAREGLEAAQSTAAEKWNVHEASQEASTLAQSAADAASVEASDVATRVEARRLAVEAVRAAEHGLAMAAAARDAANTDLERTTAAASGGDAESVRAATETAATAQDAFEKNRAAADVVGRANSDAARAQAALDDATGRATRARQTASAARQAADQSKAAAAAFPANLDALVDQAAEHARALADRTAEIRGEYNRLAGSIKALEATTNPECPTCSTSLADPSALLATLRTTNERVMADGHAAKTAADAAEQAVAAARARAQQAQQAQQKAAHDETTAISAETAADEADAPVEGLTEARDLAATAAADAASAASEARAQADTIRQARDDANTALRRAENAATAHARLTEVTEHAKQAAEQCGTAEQNLTTAQENLSAPQVPEEERARVQAALTAATTAAREASTRAQSAETEFRVAEERVVGAEREKEAEEIKLRARQETLAEYETKVTVVDALEAFRKDRVARIAPELSEVTTDFVTRMTDGKFVSVVLDEEFTPVLTDADGNERPVSWLSGGEESAVALALRVALGELIAGSKGGLLWMDEVLTAQDTNRRASMMTAISDLPGRQIVTINHVSEATDMVDLVLDVIPDPVNGSSVVPADRVAEPDVDLDAVDEDSALEMVGA